MLLGKWTTQSDTEKHVANIVLNESTTLNFNDARLNSIAMKTWNSGQSQQVFLVLNKSITPGDYSWKAIYQSLLALRTIVYFGSEIAIDAVIELAPFIYKLQDYNSALVKNKLGFPTGGTDYGAPVRQEAKALYAILVSDSEIRKVRAEAKAKTGGDLVPLGDRPTDSNPSSQSLQFGAGVNSTVGASYAINHVPVSIQNFNCIY